MDLNIELVQQLKKENEANAKDLQVRLKELKLMSQQTEKQTEKCSFVHFSVCWLINLSFFKKEFGVESFGALHLRTLNRLLVSCSYDKCIKVWDLDTFKCKRTIKGHTGLINYMFCFLFFQWPCLLSSASSFYLRIGMQFGQVKIYLHTIQTW